jgi:hypothetical protein
MIYVLKIIWDYRCAVIGTYRPQYRPLSAIRYLDANPLPTRYTLFSTLPISANPSKRSNHRLISDWCKHIKRTGRLEKVNDRTHVSTGDLRYATDRRHSVVHLLIYVNGLYNLEGC